MAKVELKQPIVDQIAEEIKDAQSVVLVDHRGLTVAQDTELRKQLREAGVVYKVYKNTMMKRAFEGTDFAALDGCLEGPSATPIFSLSSLVSCCGSFPKSVIRPESPFTSPKIALKSVLFPAPFAPTIPVICPGSTLMVQSNSKSSYRFLKFSIDNITTPP